VTSRRGDLLLDQGPASGPTDRGEAGLRWTDLPTHKARAGVERAVGRLLDALAPEQSVVRAARPPPPVEQHRTPRGCVLQAPAAALSVSWFPDAAGDTSLGELQILAWRGVVSRPGASRRGPGGATVARALVLRPDEREARADRAPIDDAPDDAGVVGVPAAAWGWRAADGTRYETDALAAHCLSLLEQQVAGDDVSAAVAG